MWSRGSVLAVFLLASGTLLWRAGAQMCDPPGLPCDTNIIIADDQFGVSVEDNTKTCFECVFDGQDSSDATWDFNNPSVGSLATVTAGILEICNIEGFGSSQLVTCTISDTHSVVLTFRVFNPPEITPDIETIVEGEELSLQCSTNLAENFVTSRGWYGPDGMLINEISRVTVTNINRDATGNYTCFIVDDRNETMETAQFITVQFAPEPTSTDQQEADVFLGGTFSRTCDYIGVPQASAWWRKDGSNLTSGMDGVDISTTDESTTLTVTTTTRDSAGVYECVFVNEVGTAMRSFTITILVPPDPATSFTIGDTRMFEVDVSWVTGGDGGSPITGIDIQIFTDRFPNIPSIPGQLVATQSFVDSPATLMSLDPFTNYFFDLFVINAVGSSESVTQTAMTQSLRLGAPMVTLEADSSTQLTLGWTPPAMMDSTENSSQWTVEFRLDGTTELCCVESPILDPTNTTVMITGLEKGTSYQARVAGSNSVGPGIFSDFVTQQTDVDPPSMPLNLVVTGPGATALNMTWDPPSDDGGRPITQYQLEIREEDGGVFEVLTTVTETFHFEREQANFVLVENTTYEVQVRAMNSAGLGDPITALGLTQSIQMPQAIFDEPTDSTVTNISAMVTWEPAEGFVVSYTVQFRLAMVPTWDDDRVMSRDTDDNTTTTLVLTGLMPSSTYLVRIFTNNAFGASEPSPEIRFSTQSAPPPTIVGPSVQFAGTSVTLTCFSPLTDSFIWSRPNMRLPADHVISNSGANLTIPNPVVADSGIYVCMVGNTAQNHSLVFTEPEPDDVSIEVIIGVCVAGGVALLIFIVVALIACCYCCRSKKSSKAASYNLKPKKGSNMNWIETSANQNYTSQTRPGEADAAASGFDIPEDYQTHSSFNTMEKQQTERIIKPDTPDLPDATATEGGATVMGGYPAPTYGGEDSRYVQFPSSHAHDTTV